MRHITIALVLMGAMAMPVKSQIVYLPAHNVGIYDFIDELANAGVVDVNSAIKPYSRKQIAHMLQKASEQKEMLSKRQQVELAFYLRDFGKELHKNKDFHRRFDVLYYRDSLFTATANPLLGVNVLISDTNTVYRRWVGAEAWGYIGEGFGIYANLRDYRENIRLASPSYLGHFQGGNYKRLGKSGEFSEMQGGVTWDWGWGTIGLVKDRPEWGSGYNGANILGGTAPSYTMLKLMIKPARWFELNFIHGWLVSHVIDSSQSYTSDGTPRNVFRPKYIAANFFTFTPLKRLNLSFGNSVVYSDMDVHPAYLTPFFFYKSIDHHLNGMSNYTGQNSQMFFDISSRQIKHLHLFLTLFLDEIAMSRMLDENRHSNFFSLKTGFRISNFPLQNVSIIAEYTRNNPQVYEHIIETTNFESNLYNLGHYLRENSQELFLSLTVKPFAKATLGVSYTQAQKGPNTSEASSRLGLPFMESVEWEAQIVSTTFTMQVLNSSYLYAGFDWAKYSGNTQAFTPDFLTSQPITFTLGGCYGF